MIIKYVSPIEFENTKKALENVLGPVFDSTEKYGLTISAGKDTIILLCNDPSLSEDEKKIILWHEKAHAEGILDEEAADKWAMKHLNKSQKALLVRNWSYRHGHNYK